jgi:hypothetical protein
MAGKSSKPKESTATSKSSVSQKSILSAAIKRKSQPSESSDEPNPKRPATVVPSAMKCVAVLPGLGAYESSDDSDNSSEFSEDCSGQGQIDLTGRKIKKKQDDESD